MRGTWNLSEKLVLMQRRWGGYLRILHQYSSAKSKLCYEFLDLSQYLRVAWLSVLRTVICSVGSVLIQAICVIETIMCLYYLPLCVFHALWVTCIKLWTLYVCLHKRVKNHVITFSEVWHEVSYLRYAGYSSGLCRISTNEHSDCNMLYKVALK